MESGEGEAIIKPKFINRLGSTNQSEKIDKYFTPACCHTKPYQSEFGVAVASGQVTLDSPEPLVDNKDTDKKSSRKPRNQPRF